MRLSSQKSKLWNPNFHPEGAMPKFHFVIIDAFRLEDPVGLDYCKSEQQSHQVAEDNARQIVIDIGETAARKIVVLDDNGVEIYRMPV